MGHAHCRMDGARDKSKIANRAWHYLNFKDMTVQWDTAIVPMKPIDATIENSYVVEDSEAVKDATERIKKILDAKHEPANIDDVVSRGKSSCLNF